MPLLRSVLPLLLLLLFSCSLLLAEPAPKKVAVGHRTPNEANEEAIVGIGTPVEGQLVHGVPVVIPGIPVARPIVRTPTAPRRQFPVNPPVRQRTTTAEPTTSSTQNQPTTTGEKTTEAVTTTSKPVESTTTGRNDSNASSGQKGSDGKGDKDGEKKTDEDSAEKEMGVDWIGAGYAAVLAMNLGAILFVRMGLDKLNRTKEICEQIVDSTHVLAQTTVHVGVGPTTKETLAAYARERSEFKRLNKQ